MLTRPVDGAFGVEVLDLDPIEITNEDAAALRDMLTEHRVLVFRNVTMTPAQTRGIHVVLWTHHDRGT